MEIAIAGPRQRKRTPIQLLQDLILDRSSSNQTQRADVNERDVEQDVNDQQYQSQVRRLLAQLRCELVGSTEAQDFFEQATKNGLPGADSLRFCNNYITSFDRRLKHPTWMLEYYTPDRTKRTDKDRARLSSRKTNTINKRLMNYDVCSSHVAPQMPELTKGPWMKLEEYVNHLAGKAKKVYVITGALYLPEDGSYTYRGLRDQEYISYRLVGRAAVPTHLYKVIAYKISSREKLALEAFVLPNSEYNEGRKRSLEEFRVDIKKDLHSVERSSGLLFFDFINRESSFTPDTVQFNFSPRLDSDGASSSSAAPRGPVHGHMRW